MSHCTVCGRLYLNERSLIRHIQSHHNQQQLFTCDQCGKSFNRADNQTMHRRSCNHHHLINVLLLLLLLLLLHQNLHSVTIVQEVLWNAMRLICRKHNTSITYQTPSTPSNQHCRNSNTSTKPTNSRFPSILYVTRQWIRVLLHNHQLP